MTADSACIAASRGATSSMTSDLRGSASHCHGRRSPTTLRMARLTIRRRSRDARLAPGRFRGRARARARGKALRQSARARQRTTSWWSAAGSAAWLPRISSARRRPATHPGPRQPRRLRRPREEQRVREGGPLLIGYGGSQSIWNTPSVSARVYEAPSRARGRPRCFRAAFRDYEFGWRARSST